MPPVFELRTVEPPVTPPPVMPPMVAPTQPVVAPPRPVAAPIDGEPEPAAPEAVVPEPEPVPLPEPDPAPVPVPEPEPDPVPPEPAPTPTPTPTPVPAPEPAPGPDLDPEPEPPDPLHDPIPAPEPDPMPTLTDAQALALREPELAGSGLVAPEPPVTEREPERASAPEPGPESESGQAAVPVVEEEHPPEAQQANRGSVVPLDAEGYAPTPRLSPPPTPGAKPRAAERTVVVGGRVFEGDPDEPSRSRGRLVRFALGALVAFVSLVVLVIVLVDSSTSKVGTPTAPVSPQSSAATTTPTLEAPRVQTVPLVIPTLTLPSGLQVSRIWQLTGDQGNRFLASVQITNPTAKNVTDSVVEVIPKLLATNVSQVRFTGVKPVVLRADPVVRFDVTLAPGARERVGYSVDVPASGVGRERLVLWKAARDREQAALDLLLAGRK
jgi:hypothetical protein